jgi:hypothetical protein
MEHLNNTNRRINDQTRQMVCNFVQHINEFIQLFIIYVTGVNFRMKK